ncbi:hypothetical protein [Gordonia rhizosphera]|uniref:hypothetical protein n=1 Tax=Gordonia rhizosphera TaxID=83341 RepID=UPI0002F5360B|nr:hypothetical protein [Gordonia rhizosphera]
MSEPITPATRFAITFFGVDHSDLGLVGMQAPGLGTDALQQEWVAASRVDHGTQGVVADRAASGLDRLPEASLDVAT